MKHPKVFVSCAVAAVVAGTYLASGHGFRGIPNRRINEQAVETPTTREPESATPTAEVGVGSAVEKAVIDSPPKNLAGERPKPEGAYSATIRPYLDDLSQMLADMKLIASTDEAVTYESKFRSEMPRMSTNVVTCIAGLANLELAVQGGEIAPEIIQAEEMLNELELNGPAIDAEMARIEVLNPTFKTLFDQYKSLHD